jgi:hypothetical protein
MKKNPDRTLLPLLLALFLTGPLLRAQSEITAPITVPLIYTQIAGGGYKWGINLSIGDGATPGLFEFDTGGTGFYAAYATNSTSPWWGSTPVGTTVATNHYDSGLTYLGTAVQSSVSFWSNTDSGFSSIISATNVSIGQSTNICKVNTDGVITQNLWTPSGPATNTPPINGAFQGDFGMSLAYGSNGLANIVAQMTFGNGITPGFLVNTPLNGTNGFLQIGLTAAQTNAAGFNYFKMNTNAGGTYANSGLPYYSEQVFNATMTLSNSAITNQNNIYSTNIGITTDTGATPALHNTTNDPGFPNNLISGGDLTNGVSFTLSATNNNGVLTNITTFTTSETDDYASNNAIVSVQNKPADQTTYTNYYYNSGLFLFNQNQVVYDLQNGNIGFGPLAVPEPSTIWLILSGLCIFFLRKFFLRHRTN